MSHQIKGRIFLVGCPRSGNTLLQSLISVHSQIASWPEFQFIKSIVGQHEQRCFGLPANSLSQRLQFLGSHLRVALGIARPMGAHRFRRFLKSAGRSDLNGLFPKHGRFIGPQITAWLNALDRMALDEGKPFWLAKAPDHLYYLDYVEKFIPSARIVHIERNGADVVASLHDASRRYPDEHWGYEYSSVDRCIAQWNLSARLTRQHLHKENHLLVRYEALVDDPEAVLRDVCRFIGVEYEARMMEEYQEKGRKVVPKWVQWHAGVGASIRSANNTKFLELFDEGQRQYILERLVPVEAPPLRRVADGRA